MKRLRKALIAASVGSAATLGMVVLPQVPASAAPADVVVDYLCDPVGASSIVRNGPVKLTTNLTFATDLSVGDPLNLTWKLAYADDPRRLQAPGYFGEGGEVHAKGNVTHRSSWQGILQPRGVSDSHGPLEPDDTLMLPEMINDPGQVGRAGTISLTPGNIELDFTPPDGEVVVNDGDDADNPSDMRIVYSSNGWESKDDLPASENHVHNDLHETANEGATAMLTFVGTGVKYIGPTDKDSSKVKIHLDDLPVATIDPSRDESDVPVNDDLDGGKTLWEWSGLNYGKHTIKIEKVSGEGFMWVDAFEVSTTTAQTPTGYHSALCKPIDNPPTIVVTVGERAEPTDPPGEDPGGEEPPDDEEPPGGGDEDPENPPGGDEQQPPGGGGNQIEDGLGQVIVNPQVSTSASVTPTSASPTATKYYRAQVARTPRGGVDTGEAPEENEVPYGLMAVGMVVVMGTAGGGLLMRRRGAAHAGGAS
ncbi:hypothetical protein SAMN05421874_11431 [Nonomuraea maritima]|uniref:Uncharacterized protein n=2 Tax=Nonomuraea maritima TaxID=683260 RepID=A0A1G9GF69_9ACTN|nr:hypothetical protein SAMN05421874_11431 [Nonomuraea maritima]